MDSVADRDYLIEFLAALSTVMMHLSRFSEEVIIWNSNEYQFVEIDDAYSTGSSIDVYKRQVMKGSSVQVRFSAEWQADIGESLNLLFYYRTKRKRE